jgi:tetratricopeptide (TPR) repeat protein
VIFTAVSLHEKRPYSFLGAWFFLILAPSSSIIPLYRAMEEHRFYLPLAAVIVFLVLRGHDFFSSESGRGKSWGHAGPALALTIAAVLGLLTYSRNMDYKSEISIWEDTLKKCPYNDDACIGLGLGLLSKNRAAESQRLLERALALNPASAKAHLGMGLWDYKQGRLDDAMGHFSQAVRLDPTLASAYDNMGLVYYRRGKLREAASSYKRAIIARPYAANVYNNLGGCLAGQGKPKEAVLAYREAIRIDPEFTAALNNLGLALSQMNRDAEALGCFRDALKIDPGNPGIYRNMSISLEKLGKSEGGLPLRTGEKIQTPGKTVN